MRFCTTKRALRVAYHAAYLARRIGPLACWAWVIAFAPAAPAQAAEAVADYCAGLTVLDAVKARTQPTPFDVEISSDKLPGGGAAWITLADKAFANFSQAKFCIRGFWRPRNADFTYKPVSIHEIYLVEKSNPPEIKIVFGVEPIREKNRFRIFSSDAEYVFIGRLDTTPSTPPNAAASKIDFSYRLETKVSHPKASKIAAIVFVVIVYLLLARITYVPKEFEGLKEMSWYAFLLSPIRLTAGTFGEASISQLQIVLFTFITAGLLFYLWLRTGLLGNISSDLLALLGISALGAVGAKFTAVLKSDLDKDVNRYLIAKGWFRWDKTKSVDSAKFRQLLMTGGRLDVYKFQIAIFTLIVAAYVITSGANDLGEVKISETMLYLIGISQGIYVAGKAISDRKTALEEAVKTMQAAEKTVKELTPKIRDAKAAGTPDQTAEAQLLAKKDEYHKAATTAAEDFMELYAVDAPKDPADEDKLAPSVLEPQTA
ncbi:MAG: hypothetical protein QOH67_3382 [Hyphomicrobiales bacterium]|jgi:hypothetical protein|nr:hypothetical protein [Hyphomicrobiales bacterium]